MSDVEHDDDPGLSWQRDHLNLGFTFAEGCAALRDRNPFEIEALEEMMIYVATELWDRGFSQSEIKSAFEQAVTSLVPYAAGEERLGDRHK